MDHAGLEGLIVFGEDTYVQSIYDCFVARMLTSPGIKGLISKV